MKNKIFFFALIIAILFGSIGSTFSSTAYASSPSDYIKIMINGKELKIPADYGKTFFSTDGRTMVPGRAVAEGLGCKVDWDGSKQEVTITKENVKIVGHVNSNILSVNGETVTMDTPLVAINGRVYLAIRFIAEPFGYKVGFSNKGNQGPIVTLDSANGTSPVDNDKDNTPAPEGVKRYTTEDNTVSKSQIGSLEKSPAGTRAEGSSFNDDITKLRTFMKDTGFTITDGGTLTIETDRPDLNDRNSGFIISRTDLELDPNGNLILGGSKYPVVELEDWGLTKNEEAFANTKMLMNCAMETFKYYSQKPIDGENVWLFVDQHVKAKKNPDFSKVYSFGETKVKFVPTPYDGFGMYIVFM